jgi:hypothetical protein
MRRNPAITFAAATAVVALIGGIAATSWQWRQAEQARVQAETQRVIAQDRADKMSLLARMIAVVTPQTDSDWETVHLTLIRWLRDKGGTPEEQRDLLAAFIEALKEAGKEQILDDLLWAIPQEMGSLP